jgi:DNA repair exonuclease SbcCD ATPase subunit
MTDPKKSEERNPAAYHITNLSEYENNLKAFEAYLKEYVQSKEDIERLLREFDEHQRRQWGKAPHR